MVDNRRGGVLEGTIQEMRYSRLLSKLTRYLTYEWMLFYRCDEILKGLEENWEEGTAKLIYREWTYACDHDEV